MEDKKARLLLLFIGMILVSSVLAFFAITDKDNDGFTLFLLRTCAVFLFTGIVGIILTLISKFK